MPASTSDRSFVPLSDFGIPALPTEEVFRQSVGRILALLKRKEEKPFIADDRLTRTEAERLDDVVAPPACGPLLEEIDDTVDEWQRGIVSARRERRLVLVLPPCDGNDVIETWAHMRGHRVLDAPARSHLVSRAAYDLPELVADEIVVVPRLERWFLRQRNGLALVRRLLAAIEASGCRAIVGCNSWAWAYLSKAVDADALLPDPMTFRAFDADRLHRWFSELGRNEETSSVSFRLPGSGENVLDRDEDGKLRSDFLVKLASRSRGIPWVAWHLWRRSLRSEIDQTVGEDAKELAAGGERASEQTLWVAALDEYVLPGSHERVALLVLHALLLHGGLTVEELRLVLPTVGESNVVPVLAKSGFVERRGDAFRVRPAAYPAVVDGLRKSGFPMDGLS